MLQEILTEIKEERDSQNKKWGEQNRSLPVWMAILMEEVGEASKEAVDWYCKNDESEYSRGDFAYQQMMRLKRFREEMIQVAAVAVQIIENLDRDPRLEKSAYAKAMKNAAAYEELDDDVAEFYDNEKGDLGDIGEMVASHFGYLD